MASIDYSPIANMRPFRLADAVGAGQTIAANQFRLGEQREQVQAREGLREALQAGTPEAMDAFSKQHPEAARAHQAADVDLQSKQLNFMLSRLGYVDHIMSGVTDDASYQAALPQIQQAGVDTKDFPPNFDPQFIEQRRKQALGFKGQAELKLKQLEAQRQAERDAETKRHNLATEANQRNRNQNERDAKQRDIRNLVAAGVPKEIAEGEVYGTIKKIQDPLSFETRYIDIARDVEIGKLDNKGRWVPGPGSATVRRSGAIGAPPTAPQGGVPQGVPPHYRQIGTAGGKPVYGDPNDPNAKRYIAE